MGDAPVSMIESLLQPAEYDPRVSETIPQSLDPAKAGALKQRHNLGLLVMPVFDGTKPRGFQMRGGARHDLCDGVEP